jgi:hypothetical protein
MTIKEKEQTKELNRLRSKINSRDEKIQMLGELHADMFKNYMEAQNEVVLLKGKIAALEKEMSYGY